MQRREKWRTISDSIILYDLELSYSNPTDEKLLFFLCRLVFHY